MTEVNNAGENLGQWMRSEYQALGGLSRMIKEHLAKMPDVNRGEWLQGLKAGFDRFRAHITRNFAAQESGGYLNMIVEQRPTLADRVDGLRAEHCQMLAMAERIRVDLSETQATDNLLVADACARMQRFMAVVHQHNQRENMLALLVFNEDIGAGE